MSDDDVTVRPWLPSNIFLEVSMIQLHRQIIHQNVRNLKVTTKFCYFSCLSRYCFSTHVYGSFQLVGARSLAVNPIQSKSGGRLCLINYYSPLPPEFQTFLRLCRVCSPFSLIALQLQAGAGTV